MKVYPFPNKVSYSFVKSDSVGILERDSTKQVINYFQLIQSRLGF